MTTARHAFDAWKQADELARSAETRLAHAWDGYFCHRTAPPARELLDEVAQLRARANEKLCVAMKALRVSERPDSS